MLPSKTARYAMFGLIYFAEGAILSYFTSLNSLYLLSFNISMAQVGLMGTIAILPFIIKILFGVLSDRVNLFNLGHRKPYLILGLLVQAVCLVVVTNVNPGGQFWLFALLAFVLMSGQALYDTCTDGLALDTTPLEESGTIQGIMVGGRALGVVLISAALGWVVQNIGWNGAFYALAALTLLPLPLVLLMKEPPRLPEKRFEWAAFKAFSSKSVIALGALGALYSLIINAANQILNPFLQGQFNIDYQTAGWVTTVWGAGVVLGGLSGGRLVDRTGHRRAVQLAAGITFISVLLLAAVAVPQMVWPLVILFGVAYGYYETVYFAVSMQKTDPRIAASMFSILMAVANIGTAVGLGLSGALVNTSGFQLTFILLAALNILALPLLPVIFSSHRSQKGQK